MSLSCNFDDISSKNDECTTYDSVESLFGLFDMDAASQI